MIFPLLLFIKTRKDFVASTLTCFDFPLIMFQKMSKEQGFQILNILKKKPIPSCGVP